MNVHVYRSGERGSLKIAYELFIAFLGYLFTFFFSKKANLYKHIFLTSSVPQKDVDKQQIIEMLWTLQMLNDVCIILMIFSVFMLLLSFTF